MKKGGCLSSVSLDLCRAFVLAGPRTPASVAAAIGTLLVLSGKVVFEPDFLGEELLRERAFVRRALDEDSC